MKLEFRKLEANEIECKTVVVKNKIEVSLHNKAATCTRILNETVGPMGWEKEYTNGNKNCIVRIWDDEKNRMISKEDCGGPLTDIEGHKGQASNGFKRVCALGWGLGIELYSQPKITFPRTDDNTIYDEKQGMLVSEKYSVKEIEYNNKREITRCVIVDSKGTVVYDGPNEQGESNVEYPVEVEEELVIPEDADMQNSDYEEENDDEPISEDVVETRNDETENKGDVNPVDTPIVEPDNTPAMEEAEKVEDEIKELPDNTDGFSESDEEDFMTQEVPFGSTDYQKEFEQEVHRTNTKKVDVLKVLGITSFAEVNKVNIDLLEKTLNKLKTRPTYAK